ncbi:MAG: YbaB/EbfC family nucleoid-associated protein [Bacillota bacterium]
MDMENVVGQISFIKEKLADLDEELQNTTVSGSDNNDIITAQINGKGKVLTYKFNASQMVSLNKEKLIAAVVEATNNGIDAARELEKSRKKEIVGGVNIPDIPGLF